MKKFLKVLLWTLTFVAASAVAGKLPKLTDHGLKSDFLEYNEKYFYGALPANTTVSWADLSEWDDMGRTDRRSDGSFIIRVDPKLHAVVKQAQMTLFHEMCHEKNLLNINVATGTTRVQSEGLDGHGDAHESCMTELGKKGAFKDLW